jgi:hypothetical protein
VTANTPIDDQKYIPRTDAQELMILASAQGLGQEAYDDGTADELSELGAEFGFVETETDKRG